MNGMSCKFRVVLAMCWLVGSCAALPAAAQKCPAKDQFKGVELYSWQTAQGWRFALTPGTNRVKTESEIKAASCVGGVEDMAGIVSRLGDKQHVLWSHDKVAGLAYPPAELVERIAASARKGGVVLYGPPPEGGPASSAEAQACKEQEKQLNDRHAELARAKDETDAETARLQRESADLAVQLRAVNSGDSAAVAAHNARALEHNRVSLAHNATIAALNGRMAALHEETQRMLASCNAGALKLPKSDPAPGK